MAKVPFSIIGTHIMQIPVRVNGKDVKFLIDTGIGPTVLSENFAEELHLEETGVMNGKRMSGQELQIPLVRVPSIEVGGIVRTDLEVGVFDTAGFPDILSEIKGILSIGFFKGAVITMDFGSSFLNVAERMSLDATEIRGVRIPVEVENDGPSVSLYVKVILPGGKTGRFEVDTGSDTLILNSGLMEQLGVSPEGPGLEVFSGIDETGHDYRRYLTEIKGRVSLEGGAEVFQKDPRVVFQDIIYDGLIGHDFLKRYTVSFDIDGAEMIFPK